MVNKKAVTLASAGFALFASTASADLVYETRFQLQADGSMTAVAPPPGPAYGQFLSEAFTLFSSYRVYNKRKFAESSLEDRSQELRTGQDPGGLGDFGVIGDEVTFNPIATGGTLDISSNGFVHTDLASQFIVMELVTVEGNVFRQEFGQVQITKRSFTIGSGGSALPPSEPDVYFIEWGGGGLWDSPVLAVDGSGLTGVLTVHMYIVPAPGAAGLLAAGALGLRRRR